MVKQYDSDERVYARWTFHTAFDEQELDVLPESWYSVEVRALVFTHSRDHEEGNEGREVDGDKSG